MRTDGAVRARSVVLALAYGHVFLRVRDVLQIEPCRQQAELVAQRGLRLGRGAGLEVDGVHAQRGGLAVGLQVHAGSQLVAEEEWEHVRSNAMILTESGNLLMMAPRAKDGGEWMKLSQQLIEVSEAAIKAADAKNADRLFTIGGDIYESCSAYHQKYMDAIVNANK